MRIHPLLHAVTCCVALLLTSCEEPQDWQADLRKNLPRLGHRNFIVIADSAYPLQSAPGVQTTYIGGTQAEAVEKVLAILAAQKHVRPVVWMDSEQAKVPEADAPGIGKCRKDLAEILKGAQVKSAPHMEIIKRLDESSKLFNVTILKTDEILPYTSVFLELDCGYWNGEKENSLRAVLGTPE